MDPNGSLNGDLGDCTSEDYICRVSPLHEVLRGTTAMPTLEDFQKLNNRLSISAPTMNSMSITSEPQEESMFLVDEHSMLSYNMDVALPPPRLSSRSILLEPVGSTIPFLSDFTANKFDEDNSAIQGCHHSIMSASLKSHEVVYPAPVFENPECLFSGEEKPNTTIKSSADEELYGIMSPANGDHICPSPKSTPTQMEIQQSMIDLPTVMFHRNPITCSTSTMTEPKGLREYTCDRCNITFYKSQAYAGHMSSHGKPKRKMPHD